MTALWFSQAVWQYLAIHGEPGDFHAAALPVPRGAAANSAAQELPACGWKHGGQVSPLLALQSWCRSSREDPEKNLGFFYVPLIHRGMV